MSVPMQILLTVIKERLGYEKGISKIKAVGFMTFLWFSFFMSGGWTLIFLLFIHSDLTWLKSPWWCCTQDTFLSEISSLRKDFRVWGFKENWEVTRPTCPPAQELPADLWQESSGHSLGASGVSKWNVATKSMETVCIPELVLCWSSLCFKSSESSQHYWRLLKLASPHGPFGGSTLSGLLNNCPLSHCSESGFPSMQH